MTSTSVRTGRLRSRRPQIEQSSSRWGLLGVAVALVVVFQVTLGNFATVNNGIGILTNAVPLLVASVPAARLLIAGSIDLSIGGSYALLTVACGWVLAQTHNTVAAVAATLVFGAAIGFLNGMAARHIKINPIIVTVALGGIYAGAALATTDGNSTFDLPSSFIAIAQTSFQLSVGQTYSIPLSVVVALVLFGVGAFALTRTVSGVRSYAIGGNAQAARLNGLKVDQHTTLLYVSQQVAMGATAVLTASQVASASPSTGTGFEISVLTAVMLGGVAFSGGGGKPLGIFVGVITIGVLQAGFVYAGFNSYVQQIAQGTLLVLALSVDQVVGWWRSRARLEAGPGAAEPIEPAPFEARADRNDQAARGNVLECRSLSKTYGAVAAVRDVSFNVRAGEVVCLVGDNGAGKSTVIKMISGASAPDSGRIVVDGADASFSSPSDSRRSGIETVYQDLGLAPNIGAALNLCLGREPRRRGFEFLGLIDMRAAAQLAKDRLETVGVTLSDYFRPIGDFSGGQRQSTAIARAIVAGTKVLILDEPTAALGVRQTKNVLSLVKRVADSGAGVVLITHDVESIMEVADRVVVLALGTVLHDGPVSELTAGKLIHLMAGYSDQIAAADAPVAALSGPGA